MKSVNRWVGDEGMVGCGLYDLAYNCDDGDLKEVLDRIDFELKHIVGSNIWLLRAKTVVTTRLLTKNRKISEEFI